VVAIIRLESLNGSIYSIRIDPKRNSYGYSGRMNRLSLILSCFLTMNLCCLNILADSSPTTKIISVNNDDFIICPAKSNKRTIPNFDEPECEHTHGSKVDPQNTLIWVKTSLNIPKEMRLNNVPHSLYVSGKTSSEVYFNGELLGTNGTPSLSPEGELAGKIDAMFYVPSHLIEKQSNELVLLLSSHHGFIHLDRPINFIGFGVYADPRHFIQRSIWQSFFPLGALILGVLYFSVASFGPHQRFDNLLFLLLSVSATAQLFLELSRAIFSYSYPFQDIRLILIAGLSTIFGTGLFTHIISKYHIKHRLIWISTCLITTILIEWFTPGFDPKTAIGVLAPSFFATFIIIKIKKQWTKEHVIHLLSFVLLITTILLNIQNFHAFIYYCIISMILGFLFVQQAIKLNLEQSNRKEEQKLVAKLQFKISQNEQKTKPNKIKITTAGKLELVSSESIVFCKASGDYVEVHLTKGEQRLFSGSLKEMEKQLPETFLRVHRSYMVNMEFIKSLGSGILILTDGAEIPVSRRIMPMVRSELKQL